MGKKINKGFRKRVLPREDKDKYTRAQQKRYKHVDHLKGPATYRNIKGYDLLYRLAGFKKGVSYSVADFACGQGLVGREVANRLLSAGIIFRLSFLDVVPEQLAKIPESDWGRKVVSDLRRISAKAGTFTHGFCRYAIKNMQPQQQLEALKEINRVLKKGGVFVLQDMVSPEGLREFQNSERRAKNISAGDRVTRNNVPTEKKWVRMLSQTGFDVRSIVHDVSIVNTQDWVASGQLSNEGLEYYRRFWRNTKAKKPKAWLAYKVEEAGNDFKITYPVIIFKCIKRR